MRIKQKIQPNVKEFSRLCQVHKVKALYAFGSAVTEEFVEGRSDIDLLVELDETDPVERGEKLMSLWDKLEDFFHCQVDLLTNSSLKNPVLRKKIDKTKVLVYDGRGQKVLV